MKRIDLATAKTKTVPWPTHMISGNALLDYDPAQPGRYRVTDAVDSRVIGYLVTKLVYGNRVSLKRLDQGLDALLATPTIKC